MRLIDADKVKEHILKEGFYCDTKEDKEDTAKEIDSLFPTIESIPIDWIKSWAGERCCGDLTVYGQLFYDMIEDWEKEIEI